MNRLAQLGPPPFKATIICVNRRRVPPRTRMHSLRDAFRGLQDAWRTQPNLRLQVGISLGVIVLGMVVNLSLLEWLWVSFAIGLVIFAELMNTAIEQTIDLAVGLAPDPFARQVKDVAAGCVLVAT
ncbi:MAG: diacylglycerol kinase family protein, partial [Candidatus Omnitrophota bacterium]|nr:diacylglycerol kinase family protein [Candidatus Omnitrophota bacterium]